MLFFLTLLMSPFFPQDGMIMESAYVQEADDEDSDESVVLLGYNPSENKSGRVMTISATDEGSDENEPEIEDVNQNKQDGEIQDVKMITKDMDKEFGEMRMIQLANNIAQDMGMILKVSFN